jgi:hypothetical protein
VIFKWAAGGGGEMEGRPHYIGEGWATRAFDEERARQESVGRYIAQHGLTQMEFIGSSGPPGGAAAPDDIPEGLPPRLKYDPSFVT